MGGSEHKSGTGDAASVVELGAVLKTQVQRPKASRSGKKLRPQFGGAYEFFWDSGKRFCGGCFVAIRLGIRGKIAGFREVLRFGGGCRCGMMEGICPLSFVSGPLSVVGSVIGGEV